MLKDFLLLFKYLSVFRSQSEDLATDRELGRSLRLIPLVGLLLGLIVAVTAYYTSFIGYSIAAAISLAMEAFLTRCIHIQGMMNSLSGLHIPKDTVGKENNDTKAVSMIWAIILLIFKYTLYLILIQRGNIFWAIPLAFVFSRWLLAFCVYSFPVASYSGLSYIWKKNFNRNDFLTASLIIIILFLLFKDIYFWYAALLSVAVIFFFCRTMAKKTGGLSGDSYSAVIEWGEVFFILSYLLFYSLSSFLYYLRWMIF